ncbi:C45 family peptidase [uncultured Lactobacillus sp.]|uniref:C45 family autoproteolytic acyltransferase/hydolase n=1 Tax=uncultured Lactobacillus sp. TaxID=153152 RepID=UPI00262C6BE7|nr:C45 family peptidase [uncultured Lactobacillus sp.]
MALTEKQSQIVAKASRKDENGWHYLTVQGDPYEIGFQHGYLLTDEFKDAIRVYKHMTLELYGMDYSFFVEQAVKLHKDKIPQEYLDEMQGMADGFTAGGFETSLEDVIGWNDWMELTGYWWPTVAANYSNNPPQGPKGSHCSGFVATGSATKDGKPVIAHESFDDFWSGQYFNVCEKVIPTKGHSFKMQTVPGYIDSMTDFYVTDAGLGITETTIAGFVGYDDSGIPEFVRARRATQYANNIDEWVKIVNDGNNGGYANIWLLCDINTGEIARFEQGLKNQELLRTKDGFYYGCNACHNPRIRNLECVDNGYNDTRQQTGARRARFEVLMPELSGTIDDEVAKKILADKYDPYLGYICASSRNICAHYDVDPQYYADDPHGVWNVPFFPGGSCDGKCADSEDIKNVNMWGIFGRADGESFDAESFMKQHPQWNWQKGYLYDRPSQPWTLFD